MIPEPFSSTDDALRDLLRESLGSGCQLAGVRVLQAAGAYAVLLAELRDPDRAVVVKLCAPDDPRASAFARAASFARLARERADIPTFEVLAVDASGSHWPWAYLVASQVAGWRWREIVPFLEPREQYAVYEQLGRAAATLHMLRFPCYGQMGAAGAIVPAPTYLDALADWVAEHVADRDHAALFLRLVAERADRFADIGPPQLTHEDLNPGNLLVHNEHGYWRLSGVLDFDKAWAGCGESDLARLELWRGMTGDGFAQGYTGMLPVSAGYPDRRALYQLLWCLEYARPTPAHNADTRAVCAALGIPAVVFADAAPAS